MTTSRPSSNRGNLLYVLHSFPPCGGTGTLRMTKQIKYLDQLGWNCQVVTFQGLSSNYSDSSLLEEARTHSDIVRITDTNCLPERVWSLYREVSSLSNRRDYEWLITSSPPEINHLYGKLVSLAFGIRWHCDIRDPLHVAGYRNIKKWIVKSARINTVLDKMPIIKGSLEEGHLILNGYDPDDFPDGSTVPVENRSDGEPVELIFLGSSHQPIHDPVPIVRALGELVQSGQIEPDDFHVTFLGDFQPDSLKTKVYSMVADYNYSDSMEIMEFTDHDTAINKLQASDLALVNTSTDAIPYKFAEYVGARKPIVSHIPNTSHIHDLPLDDNAVTLVEHGCLDELKTAYSEFINEPHTGDYEPQFRDRFKLSELAVDLDELYTVGDDSEETRVKSEDYV